MRANGAAGSAAAAGTSTAGSPPPATAIPSHPAPGPLSSQKSIPASGSTASASGLAPALGYQGRTMEKARRQRARQVKERRDGARPMELPSERHRSTAGAEILIATHSGDPKRFNPTKSPDDHDPTVFVGSSRLSAGIIWVSPTPLVARKARATLPTIRRLGAPTGQPQDSPGQRPGFLRPDSTSPEGAIQNWNLFTSHGLVRPFRAWIGFGRAKPGALPRAGVGRAVGAPGPCKTSRAGVYPGRCPGLACVAPLVLPGPERHRMFGSIV